MRLLVDRLWTRLLPAVLTALGLVFVGAGLLSYASSATGDDPNATPAPTIPGPLPSPSLLTFPPLSPSASPSPSASGSPGASGRVATRIVVPALGIDLPIVRPPGGTDTYPLCNVALYAQQLHQPGEAGATYIYAHARTGMFLPLLEQSRINGGKGMIGDLVQVYTSDDWLFEYAVTEVRRGVPKSDGYTAPSQATTDQVWLQTSEGPHGTPTVLQVVATPLDAVGGIDPSVKPHPVVCGP